MLSKDPNGCSLLLSQKEVVVVVVVNVATFLQLSYNLEYFTDLENGMSCQFWAHANYNFANETAYYKTLLVTKVVKSDPKVEHRS